MAVDDAELLALAGGESSEDETPQQPRDTAKAVSPLPSIEISRADSDKFAAAHSKTANSRTRGVASKVSKKSRKDESEEEGEASSNSGSPMSMQSAPMSESDSDSSPGDDAASDAHPFPVDNKFYSEKDKKEIMSLPEIERESILAERAAIHERKMQDLRLRRLLQARENAEAKSGKRKAAGDVEESPRKSSRQKTTLGGRKVGETSSAIEAYKRQREQKGLRDEQRRREGAIRKLNRARSSSDVRHSSADADGESEVEWDDAKPKKDDYRSRNAQPADYHDYRRLTWTRNQLAQLCFYPGFENTARDCFVRIPMKPNPATQQMMYELLLIRRVTEKEGYDYAVEKVDGKRFVTNQHLVCTIEGTEKDFHFGAVSNSTVTEVEVANYKNALANDGKSTPTKPLLEAKLNEFQALIHHTFTDEELQVKLQRSGVLQKRTAPLERIAIMNRRRAAEERGDEAGIARADAELSALSGPKLRYGTYLVDPNGRVNAPNEPTQQDRLAELNRQNRKKNTEEVRRAQQAEQKAARLARQAVERGEAIQDPFARVKTHAKTHHDVNETLAPHRATQRASSRDVSRSATPGGSTPKLGPKKDILSAPSPDRRPNTIRGLPVLSSRNIDDEVLGSLDIGIDVEI